jgi:hypothetical protein
VQVLTLTTDLIAFPSLKMTIAGFGMTNVSGENQLLSTKSCIRFSIRRANWQEISTSPSQQYAMKRTLSGSCANESTSKAIPGVISGRSPFTVVWFCTKQDKPVVKFPRCPILLDSRILRMIAIVFHRIDERLAGETTISLAGGVSDVSESHGRSLGLNWRPYWQ